MKPKIKSKKNNWHWSCGWESSFVGRFHSDYEGCSAHSRKPYETEDKARKAGQRHLSTHRLDNRHCGNVNVWKE